MLILSACLACIGQAWAANILTVSDVNVPQGGQATLEVGCEFDTEYTAFELQIALPDGLSLLTDEDGYPVIEKAFDTNHILTGNLLPSNGNYKITCRSMDNISIPTDGALFRVTVVADGSLELGSSLAAAITACEFTRTADSNGETLADVDFSVSISEFRTVLDEASTTAPVAEANANVRVKRTIKAGEWSTICLPFAMTEAQCKEAFGSDVQIAEFTGAESEFDDADNVVGITVSFSDVSAIEANTPYIIKVGEAVSEFTVDGVDITPDEDEAYVEFDNGKTGSRRVVYSGFYGTYHAGTVLDENTLFLSDNQFWYSAGLTRMKAFRAYFDFLDVLTEVEEAQARILLSFGDGGTTGVGDALRLMNNGRVNSEESASAVYNLKGQRVAQPSKGLYIKDGRKVVVK